GPAADLRGVPAGRRGQAAAGGDGPRAGALETAGRAPRGPDLGRERGGRGEHLRVHPAGPDRGSMTGALVPGALVLVVEDNPKNMTLLRDVLRVSGYRTLEAATAGQALELATDHRPTLVLMDVRLPDMD